MGLVVGSITPINVLTLAEIASYTASEGDFFRGWSIWGYADCEIEIQIEGTVKAIGALQVDSPGSLNDTKNQLVTPIALSASDVIRIMITRSEIGASQDFRGEIF